ncbi:hypothetical protein Rhow_004897 [Rhodococcus wratislaviensis]|uniref:Uncharacterized protein n=1 Tax=Rhodococcus wratislaviensis TaxID=44752 RepID=A0A402CCB8_RHOWR|nr:hypothetical protein Rhow_004897 [Rhodococcus wratislaviensis]
MAISFRLTGEHLRGRRAERVAVPAIPAAFSTKIVSRVTHPAHHHFDGLPPSGGVKLRDRRRPATA